MMTQLLVRKLNKKVETLERDIVKIKGVLSSIFVEEDMYASPPVRSARGVRQALKATKRYNKKFIESVMRGIARSSYFKK